MGLRERLEWVLAHRVTSGRQWCGDAGLSGGYLGTLFTRMSRDPDADLRRDELVRLARAARVSLAWLATGDGSPDDPAPSSRRVVDQSDLYAHRATAVAMARELGIDHAAISAVLAVDLGGAPDPSVRAWLEEAMRVERRLSNPFARARSAARAARGNCGK